MILPATYEVSGALSSVTVEAAAFGGFIDVFKGSLGVADVSIKRLRISTTGDGVVVKKVLHPHNIRLDFCALTSIGGTLQGSCDVEAPRSPEHRALQGCHVRSSPNRVRMDAWWRVKRVYQE